MELLKSSVDNAVLLRRILVVDDNRDSAESMQRLLKLLGGDVRLAYDGIEALDRARDFQPDIIMLDLGLPKLSGIDAALQIRQEPWGKKMFLIALTGWSQEEDKRRSKDAGFDLHLVKPVDPRILEKIIAEVQPAPL